MKTDALSIVNMKKIGFSMFAINFKIETYCFVSYHTSCSTKWFITLMIYPNKYVWCAQAFRAWHHWIHKSVQHLQHVCPFQIDSRLSLEFKHLQLWRKFVYGWCWLMVFRFQSRKLRPFYCYSFHVTELLSFIRIHILYIQLIFRILRIHSHLKWIFWIFYRLQTIRTNLFTQFFEKVPFKAS